MIQLKVFVFVALLACLPHATSFADGPIQIPIAMENIGEGRYQLNITTGHFNSPLQLSIDRTKLPTKPIWDEGDDDPPLSTKRAIELANEFRIRRLVTPKDTSWIMRSIDLVPLDSDDGIWCWRANFALRPNGMYSGEWPELPVIVLMDGSLIEPQETRSDDGRIRRSLLLKPLTTNKTDEQSIEPKPTAQSN